MLVVSTLICLNILLLNSSQPTWTYCTTQLPNISADVLCGEISDPYVGSVIPVGLSVDDLPAALDWRDKDGGNWLTPICWAYGSVAVTEAAINIKYNNPDLDVDLSEQHLISACCSAGNCRGGVTQYALDYINHTGVPCEDCFPSIGRDCACTPCDNWRNNTWKIANFDYIRVSDLKSALYLYGPVSVSVYIPLNEWGCYGGGVYEQISKSDTGHSVVFVGYRDGYWDSGTWVDGYWIIRNSWGTAWGEDGYMRAKYNGIQITGNHGRAITAIESRVNPGDVTNDGVVNFRDMVLLLNYMVYIGEYTLLEPDNADMTGDGSIDVCDVILLVNTI